jgi:hypothetical protein
MLATPSREGLIVTPAKVADFGPDNPLRSNSRTSSPCRGKGTNTRPPASHFNTIASLLIEDIPLELFLYAATLLIRDWM